MTSRISSWYGELSTTPLRGRLARSHIQFHYIQCSIPAFTDLLPAPDNTTVIDLLFLAAQWLSLAKLRLHTDSTLASLTLTTMQFGEILRRFKDVVCPRYQTKDTPREARARSRLRASKGKAGGSGAQAREFNLNTYKVHALGDYPATIRFFGTTDSYSTQTVRLPLRTSRRVSTVLTHCHV